MAEIIHARRVRAGAAEAGLRVIGLASALMGAAPASSVMAQPPAGTDRPAIVASGPWVFTERHDRPQTLYPLNPPTEALTPTPPGWAAFASSDGRTMDFARPWRWPVDPSARSAVTEIGFGWREPGWAATIGYVQPDYVRRAGYPSSAGPKPLVGLSFTVRVP